MLKKNEIFEIGTGEYEDAIYLLYKAIKDFDFESLLKAQTPKKRNYDAFIEYLITQKYCERFEIQSFYLKTCNTY